MRTIILIYSDYDIVSGESWTDNVEGYLITPHVVLYKFHDGFGFHCFKEAIGSAQMSVDTRKSKHLDLHVSGASVDGIDFVELATLTVAELGVLMATQIH